MSTANRRIAVGVDGAEIGTLAVKWAAQVASERKLELVIVHLTHGEQFVYGGGLSGYPELLDAFREDGLRILEAAEEVAHSIDPALDLDTVLQMDSAARYLIELSSSVRMIVVGASGRSAVTSALLGSTASAVLSHAHCPVAVVRGRTESAMFVPDGPVVVGIDSSPFSEAALEIAFDEASIRAVPLIAVHAWTDAAIDEVYGMSRLSTWWETRADDERRLLAERLAGRQEKYPDVAVERVLARDNPRQVLLDYSAKAQLVVVGSRGRGGFRGLLLGSTSQGLAHHAKCPVLVVRG
ncbi:MAG: hypothetical protein JWQ81_3785 [Amycolatopsis sp.]|uniref:universal stress protein n=1 Tax=Amycolatopsis sp. TaxID=37632 RepID=UPI00260C560A|nr:universal stress protein [Amycolatopsis sp.]MCU1683046.1 hypothetical protein [Amycolatopsis sp.]